MTTLLSGSGRQPLSVACRQTSVLPGRAGPPILAPSGQDRFAAAGARKFVTWTLAPDHPSRSYRGVFPSTVEEELPRLRRSIDDGVPVVLGLVRSRRMEDLGANHQVVAYAYELDGQGGRPARGGRRSTRRAERAAG